MQSWDAERPFTSGRGMAKSRDDWERALPGWHL